jgi:TetR/AcrR family transcriptional regulator, lmrAB and yxaGH operons repressor
MARSTEARRKALESAERLFRAQGYAATGLAQILAESGAPKGSFYFHFPGGKEQLAREVLAAYGARTEAWLRGLAEKHTGDPAGFVRALCRATAREMQTADWATGCLAQTLALELAPAHGEIADALAVVFAGWSAAIAAAIEPGGRPSAAARRRAMAVIAALEGARTLARATRSAMPFDAIAEELLSRGA